MTRCVGNSIASARQAESCLRGGAWPPAAYYIEYPERRENRARLDCQLSQSFCPVLAHDGVHANESTYRRWQEEGYISADAFSDVASAASSFAHLAVWRRFLADGSGGAWAAVFESDAILRQDFPERLAELRPVVERGEVDLIWLGHCSEACPQQPQQPQPQAEQQQQQLQQHEPQPGSHDLGGGVWAVPSRHPVCSHAYLVSRRGAELLVQHSSPLEENIDARPMRSLSLEGKLRSLSVCPMVVRQPWLSWDDGLSHQRFIVLVRVVLCLLIVLGASGAIYAATDLGSSATGKRCSWKQSSNDKQ